MTYLLYSAPLGASRQLAFFQLFYSVIYYTESGFNMTVTDTDFNGQFGLEVLRNHVIPDILGRHEADILYWAGKSLARKFPLASMDDAPDFFRQAHFGELKIERSSKGETSFHLAAPGLEQRCFKLEAGFLAQQKQNIDGFMTEAFEESLGKKKGVRITLKTDLRDKV